MTIISQNGGTVSGVSPRVDPGIDRGVEVALERAPAAWRTPALGTVSLVIPAKNEAANIIWVLQQVPDCLDEIILVDGHSTDATVTMARSCRPDLRVVPQQGVGKGDAMRMGFEAASGDLIVMMDADGAWHPRRSRGSSSSCATATTSSRLPVRGEGGSLDLTRLRRRGNRALMQMVNSLYDAGLTDLCYGYVGCRRRYLDHLDLTTTGFETETQLTISALRAGLRIAEVPSLELPRRYGRSNLRTFSDGTRVLRTILRSHSGGISGTAVQGLRRWLHRAPGE